jgi:hypothetical protein
VVLRARLPNHSPHQALATIHGLWGEALQHRDYPFLRLLGELTTEEQRATMPYLGLNANFHFYDMDAMAHTSESVRQRRGGEVRLGPVRAREQAITGVPVIRPHYDLTCGVWHANGALSVGLRYNVRLLGRPFVEALADAFLDGLSALGAPSGPRERDATWLPQ